MNDAFWDALGVDLTLIGRQIKITPYMEGILDTYILVLSCMGFDNLKIKELFLKFGVKYNKDINLKREK